MRELYPRLEGLVPARAALGRRPEHRRRGDPSGSTSRSICSRRSAATPGLQGWNGVGFVVQAYQKRANSSRMDHRTRARDQAAASWCGSSRAPIGTARSSARRSRGWRDSPVFTRKIHTDVSYHRLRETAARRPGRGLSAIRHPQRADGRDDPRASPGGNFYAGQYEFQCLHGMGEPLYSQIVGNERGTSALPHLCAGRLARNAARLSRAPLARERRQHLVRQSHRRPERACRGAD